jgi:hypothetical protein
MKRFKIVLGLVAETAAMTVAFAAPAVAANDDRADNCLDRLDDRFGLDGGSFLVADIDFSYPFVADQGSADESCGPLSSDAINNTTPRCIFGSRNEDLENDPSVSLATSMLSTS